MPNASNIIEYARKNKEKFSLIGYFILILILSVPLVQMFIEAWDATRTTSPPIGSSGLSRSISRAVRFGLFDPILDSSHQNVSFFGFGLYLGLLSLMSIDIKKRWQAVLLWIGTIVGIIAITASGRLFALADWAQFPAFAGGAAAGLFVGGGQKLLRFDNIRTLEFRRASRILYLLFAILTVISLLELHIQYPNPLAVESGPTVELSSSVDSNEFGVDSNGLVSNFLISGAFIFTVRRFVQYEANKDFFILGPRGSGKSLFLIGCYLEALDQRDLNDSQSPLAPSKDLMDMIASLEQQDTDWIVEATEPGELKNLDFQYTHGTVFPMNISVSAADYAGEYLSRLPDAITGAVEEQESNGDVTLRRLSEGVQQADTVIFVIDLERFADNESLDIAEYFSIIQSTNNKEEMLVATKADILAEEFREERGLDAHLYYDEFIDFVNARLQQSENIGALITESSDNEIYPVYYQTKINESGERVPMRDETGSVMTVGFDRILQKFGEN